MTGSTACLKRPPGTGKRRCLLYCLLLPVLILVGCATVPLTNRRQRQLAPDIQMSQLSFQQYEQVLKESKISDDTEQAETVRRVGTRVARAVEDFLAERNQSMDFDWELNLIEDDKQANAWCMPGGKITLYSRYSAVYRK
jgi:predicted Zn-dependent protease